MAKPENVKRCSLCGKKLSKKSTIGVITWGDSHPIREEFCYECYQEIIDTVAAMKEDKE